MKNLILIGLMCVSFSLAAQQKDLRTFYDDGSIKSLYSYTDADNYNVTNYYPNGKVKERGQFVNGKMSGVWNSFNESGVLTAEASYVDGQKEGEWRVYDGSGALRYKVTYANNRMANATSFDQAGKLVAETQAR